MVAISLYRGNLHRVPDVPRQWLMPIQPISVKHFKSLLSRRTRSLPDHLETNPNPSPNSIQQQSHPIESQKDDVNAQAVLVSEKDDRVEKLDGGDWLEKPIDGSGLATIVANNGNGSVDEIGDLEAVLKEEKISVQRDALNEKEKRRKEVEDKLQILNARKHNLVQVLKQILNVEEELKRRNSMPALPTTHPFVPLQVDTTSDSGLMTRHGTPKMGSEAMEGAEADDVSNHNMASRYLGQMSSTSPTSESPFRRSGYPQHNAVTGPHPSRATFGAAGSPSPSRFAPMGHQSHPQIMPTVSASGTNYIASSPSPAASGGTSIFRDARQPSPWN